MASFNEAHWTDGYGGDGIQPVALHSGMLCPVYLSMMLLEY